MAIKWFSFFILCCIAPTLRGNEFLIDRDLIQKKDGFKFNFQKGRGEVKGTGFKSVGCWKDSWDRAIEPLEGKHELLQDTNYKLREDPLRKCAIVSLDNHLQMFAIENGGQCLGDKTAASLYQRFGPAIGCKDDGYGGPWSMQVYSFTGFEVKPRHGRYTKWSPWTKCSKACDKGIKERSRSCTHPRPANGGMDCRRFGPSTQTKSCNNECMGEESENLNEPPQSLSPVTATFMSSKVSSITNSPQSADNAVHKKDDLDYDVDEVKDDEDDKDLDDDDDGTSTSKSKTKTNNNLVKSSDDHAESNNEMAKSNNEMEKSNNEMEKSNNEMEKSNNDMPSSGNMAKSTNETKSVNEMPESTNDIGKSTNGIDKPSNDMAKSTNDMAKSTNDMAKSTNDMAKSTNDMAKSTNDIGKSTNDIGKPSNDIAKSTNDMAKSTNDMAKSTNDMAKSTNDIGKSTNDMEKSTNDMEKSTNDMEKPTNDMDKSTNDMEKSTNDMEKATNDMEKSTNDMEKSTNDIGKSTNDIGKTTKDIGKPSNDIGKTTNDIGKSTNDIGKTTKDIGQPSNDLEKSTTDTAKSTNDFGKSTNDFGKSTNDFGKSTNDFGKSTNDISKPINNMPKYDIMSGINHMPSSNDKMAKSTDNGAKLNDDATKPINDLGKSNDGIMKLTSDMSRPANNLEISTNNIQTTNPTKDKKIDEERQEKMWDDKIKAAHDLLRARWLSLARNNLQASPIRDEHGASRHYVNASLKEDEASDDVDEEMDDENEEAKAGKMGEKTKIMDEKTGEMGDKVEGVDRKTGEMGDKAEGVDRKTGEMGDKVEGVDEKTGKMGDKAEGVDRKTGEMGDKAEGVDEKIGEMGDKAEGVDGKTGEMGDKAEGVDGKTGEMGNKAEGVDGKTGEMGDKAEGVDGKTGEMGNKAEGVDGKTGEMGDKAEGVDEKTGEMGNKAEGVDEKTGDMGDKAEGVDEKSGEMGDKAEGVDEKTGKMGDKAEGAEISPTKRVIEECICPAVMCTHLADTGVLIDNSNVTDIADLAEMKSFAKGLAAGFGTEEKDIQMGIIAAGMRSQIIVPFHETLPLHEVDKRVDEIQRENGPSSLGEAFKRAEAYLLAKQKKAIPPLLNDVLFVMASGDSDVDVHAPVKDLKAGGAKIVVIGVGKNAKLGKVASSADKVFMVPPGAGNALVNAIIAAVCQSDLMGKVNPNPKPCPCMLDPTKKRTSTELFAARNTPYSPLRNYRTVSSTEPKLPEMKADKEMTEATGTPLKFLQRPLLHSLDSPLRNYRTVSSTELKLPEMKQQTTGTPLKPLQQSPPTPLVNPPKTPSFTLPAVQPATPTVSPPLASHGSLPAASQGGLPAFSPKSSPLASHASPPAASQGGLPAFSPKSPPLASHGSLPAASQGSLPAFSPKSPPLASHGSLPAETAPASTPAMPPAVLPVKATSQLAKNSANLKQNSLSENKVIHLSSGNIKPLSASLSALSRSLNKARSAGELKEGNFTLTNDIQDLLKDIASLKNQADDLRSSGKESEIEQSGARPAVGQSALSPKVSSHSTPLSPKATSQSTLNPKATSQSTLNPKAISQSTLNPKAISQSTPLSIKATSQSTLSPKATSQSTLNPKATSQSTLNPKAISQSTPLSIKATSQSTLNPKAISQSTPLNPKATSQSTLNPKATSQSTLSPKPSNQSALKLLTKDQSTLNSNVISQVKQRLETITKATNHVIAVNNGQPSSPSNVLARASNSPNKNPTQSKNNVKQADLASSTYGATHNARLPLASRIPHDAPLSKHSNTEEAKISKPTPPGPSQQSHPQSSSSVNDVTHWPEKITSTSAPTVQNSNFLEIESTLSKHSGTPGGKLNRPIPDCDINLGFVLDGSASIEGTKRENFLKMINFVKDVIHQFAELSRQVHVGTLVYSTNTSVILTFGTKGTEEMIDRLLDNVHYPGQGSLTGNALKESWNSMFSSVPRGRKSKLVLLTDGPSNDDIAGPSKWIKDSGVELFAIGLGTAYDEKQLNTMASGPAEKHVMIKQYDELKTSVQEVRNKVCGYSSDEIIQIMNSPSHHNEELFVRQKHFKPNQCILDVAFLLDGSRQVETNGEGNFQRQIDFVKKVAKYLPINRDDVHMGVGLLGDSDVMVFPMNEHYTKSAVDFELDHVQYPASELIHLEQLRSARDIMLRRGIRDVAPHVFVLVTDVSSLDFYRKSIDKMRSEGTEVVLFGIGSYSWKQEVKVPSSVEGLVNQIVTIQSGDEDDAVKHLAQNLCELSNKKRSEIPHQHWKYSKKVLNSKL